MDRAEFVAALDHQVKLVRTEYGFTQDVMARVLGISKKTLVEIEKGRSSLGWMGAVALCSIFSDSQILERLLGGEAGDMIQALAFQDMSPGISCFRTAYPRTLGGHVWWRFVEKQGNFTIQQNIISQHYRALTPENERVVASFDLEYLRKYLSELSALPTPPRQKAMLSFPAEKCL